MSEEVYDKVLENGLNWYDRAFVVKDWYLSAYDPIHDVLLYINDNMTNLASRVRTFIFHCDTKGWEELSPTATPADRGRDRGDRRHRGGRGLLRPLVPARGTRGAAPDAPVRRPGQLPRPARIGHVDGAVAEPADGHRRRADLGEHRAALASDIPRTQGDGP